MRKPNRKPETLILTEESIELWSKLFHQALYRISRGIFKYRVSDADLMRKYSAQDYAKAARVECSVLVTWAYCGLPLDDIEVVFADDDPRQDRLSVQRTFWREDKFVMEVSEVAKTRPSAADLSPLERAEKRTIEQYLILERGVKNRVRKALDITVNTLNAKIEKYGISLERAW